MRLYNTECFRLLSELSISKSADFDYCPVCGCCFRPLSELSISKYYLDDINVFRITVSVSSRSYLFPNPIASFCACAWFIFPSPLGVIYFQITTNNVWKFEDYFPSPLGVIYFQISTAATPANSATNFPSPLGVIYFQIIENYMLKSLG